MLTYAFNPSGSKIEAEELRDFKANLNHIISLSSALPTLS